MEKKNLGKKIMIGIILLVIIVIAIITVNGIFRKPKKEIENNNEITMVTNEVKEDVPEEQINQENPDEEKQVGVGE